jgi:hypothetical protein
MLQIALLIYFQARINFIGLNSTMYKVYPNRTLESRLWYVVVEFDQHCVMAQKNAVRLINKKQSCERSLLETELEIQKLNQVEFKKNTLSIVKDLKTFDIDLSLAKYKNDQSVLRISPFLPSLIGTSE